MTRQHPRGGLPTYAGIPDHVYESDLPYANTGGNTARPELLIGRIIGNNAVALGTPLSLVINVYEGAADAPSTVPTPC